MLCIRMVNLNFHRNASLSTLNKTNTLQNILRTINKIRYNTHTDQEIRNIETKLYLCHDVYTTVQITFIFIGQTRLVFGNRVCTCVTKHSNTFQTFLNWLKNSKHGTQCCIIMIIAITNGHQHSG